jgi:hypothetical protein
MTRVFLTRFFENDITTGTDDLKGTFFWLVAALAMPGIFIPWLRVFDWEIALLMYGTDGLRMISRADKCFYLSISMISSGALAAMTWNSMLPDRRDALILGALPVPPTTIIASKLLALATYLLMIAVLTHSAGALFFGTFLSRDQSFSFVVRGIVGHFVASAAGGIAIALTISALQGACLSVLRGRVATRAMVALQVGTVTALTLGAALTLPASVAIRTALDAPGAESWVLWMPFVWFLGLYEVILGTNEPLLHDLAGWALATFSASAIATMVLFPLVYRRATLSGVESSFPGSALSSSLRAGLVRLVSRRTAVQGAADFLLTTVFRAGRQRFVLASVVGLAAAFIVPGIVSSGGSLEPTVKELSFPLAAELVVLVGFRIVAALPADNRAAWLFESLHVSPDVARTALERTLLLFVVLPVATASVVLYWNRFGATVATMHGFVTLSIGALILQLLVFRPIRMPCGQPWDGARFDVVRRWPVYGLGGLIVIVGVPKLELLFGGVGGASLFVAVIIGLSLVIRRMSLAQIHLPHDLNDSDPVAGVLRLQ